MPPASRAPWDLAQWMSQRLGRASVPHRAQADPLIAWASWHLTTAQLGWDLFERAAPDGDNNLTGHPLHFVEIAAENLFSAARVSAMDLCAGAVFRSTGEPLRTDRQRDVNWWFQKPRKNELPRPWNLPPKPLAGWLRVFDSNDTWALATELRHVFTHRTAPRHVTVTVGLGQQAGATTSFDVLGDLHNAAEVMPNDDYVRPASILGIRESPRPFLSPPLGPGRSARLAGLGRTKPGRTRPAKPVGTGGRSAFPLVKFVERTTGFEPATPTLARWCSTN